MADEQGLDEVARLLADFHGAGRVIGARRGGEASCDVELVMLSRANDGYRLRSTVVGLERLGEVRGDLFADPFPEAFTAEDLTFPTLEDALRSAQTLALASRTDPIPDLARWVGTPAFLENLNRSRLRSKIPWLPQPPRWWPILKGVLGGAAFLASTILPAVIAWAVLSPKVGVWDDWLIGILGLLLFLGIGFGMIGLVNLGEPVLERIERRLERDGDGHGDSTASPGGPPPTARVASVDPDHSAPRGGRTPEPNVPVEPGRRAAEAAAAVPPLSASQALRQAGRVDQPVDDAPQDSERPEAGGTADLDVRDVVHHDRSVDAPKGSTWLRWLGGLALIWGLTYLPWDMADQARARHLVEEGSSWAATTVRVNPDQAWWEDWSFWDREVRHVEVKVPGVSGDQWLNLTGVVSPGLAEQSLGTRWVVGGWPSPTVATSYTPPLDVRYSVDTDGEVAVMAAADMYYWLARDNAFDLSMALGGAALIAFSFLPYLAWKVRKHAGA